MNNMENGIAAADSAAAQAQEAAEEALSSSLPTPTSADIGKVATVVGETSKGVVIVPPQTPVNNTLSNGNPSLFAIGETVIVTIDGTDYSCVVEVGKDDLKADTDGNGTVTYDEIGGFRFIGLATTVAVYAVSASASWQPAAPSGGVLVVHEVDGTLDKTWQEIYDALPIAVLDIPSTSTRKLFDRARTDLHGLFVSGGEYYAANSASGYPEKTITSK